VRKVEMMAESPVAMKGALMAETTVGSMVVKTVAKKGALMVGY
jgi:hypothetical protein